MRKQRWMVYVAFMAVLGTGMALGGTALAASDWQAPPEADGYENPNAPSDASVAAGQEVYEQYCKLCHGASGAGDGPSAASLEVPPADFTNAARMNVQSDGALAWKILNGRGPMPSWAPVLTEEQIWNVINYIRSLSS